MPETKEKPAALVIPLTPCKSSNIKATGYDAASKTLAVQFSSGHTYHYGDVGADVFEKLGKAKSVGAFFATDIRNAFKGSKQEEPKKEKPATGRYANWPNNSGK